MKKIEDILQVYEQGPKDAFKFFAFWSPPITDEQYGWVKECGYTHLLIDQKYDALFGTEKMGQAVALAEKHGLKAILSGENFVECDHPYADIPAFDGAYVDEPLTLGDLEKLSNELVVFQEKHPGKCFYINLVSLKDRSWDTYSEYFKSRFLSSAVRKTVSGDTYPLREPDKDGVTMVPFLDYIRRVGKVAAETDSELYFFIQTIAMHGANWAHPARRPSTEDIRFLSYVILACGAKGFQHFCYMSPGLPPYTGEFKEEDYACIHPDGYRTELWYSAQEVIAEFKKFENIFLKFQWKGIIPIYGEQAEKKSENFQEINEYISNHSDIASVSASQDLLIGCFEDQDGNTGLVILNFCDPYQKKENHIALKLNTNEKIAVIRNGETAMVSLNDGCFDAVLAPGEGQFLIIPTCEPASYCVTQIEKPVPTYLIPPEHYHWKEDYRLGNYLDTYNIYGAGNSHFEYMESGYPEGGSGRVVRFYSSTHKEKDWSTYRFRLPDIPYDTNKKLVFKMFFTECTFSVSVSCDHMVNEYRAFRVHILERVGTWTWFEVPLKEIGYDGLEKLGSVTMCIGDGIPYGTTAYLDEILLCDL